MRTVFVVALGLCGALSLLGACGSDDDGASPVGGAGSNGGGGSSGQLGPETAAEFIDQYVAAHCAMTSYCCSENSRQYDAEGCQQRGLAVYSSRLTDASYDRATAQACLDLLAQARAYDEAHCPSDSGSPFNTAESNPCSALIKYGDGLSGTSMVGGPCLEQSDCAPSNKGEVTCQVWYDASNNEPEKKGICQLTRPGAVGEGPCVDSIPPVAELVSCVGSTCDSNKNACVASQTGGCSSSSECGSSMRCLSGTCAPLAAEGEQCVWGECQKGLFCDVLAVKCVPQRAGGSFCAGPEECKSSICEMGECGGEDDWALGLACPQP